MAEYRKKFIALDLETTHLDVKEGQIMEVGAVEGELYFDDQAKLVKVNFGKSLSTLVNPEIPVPQLVLDLTGIKEEELRSAPSWQEIKSLLREFLGREVLLGHNLGFDLDFLKNQGLEVKNQYLDTLEIAQSLLPLRPMHSLEYLSQEFGVASLGAHRAFSDSQNTAYVLAGVLNEFLQFDLALQRKLKKYSRDSALSFRNLLLDLPETKLSARKKELSKPAKPSNLAKKILGETWPNKKIIKLPLAFDKYGDFFNALAAETLNGLVAVSHQSFLAFLPPAQKIPNPSWALCENRIQRLEEQKPTSPVFTKILIKIEILRHLRKSWDLSEIKWTIDEKENLFFVLVDAALCPFHSCPFVQNLKLSSEKVYFMDLPTLFLLVSSWPFQLSSQKLLLFDLSKIFDEFLESHSLSWSLKKIRKFISLVFPIEKNHPSLFSQLPKGLTDLTNELDLFFGILHLFYFTKKEEFAKNLLIDEAERQTERFQKLFYPTQKLNHKLQTFEQFLSQQEKFHEQESRLEIRALRAKLEKFSKILEEIFIKPKAKLRYFLKFSYREVNLLAFPTSLKEAFRELVSKCSGVTIIDAELPTVSLSYFVNQLGLENFEAEKPKEKFLPRVSLPIKIFSAPLAWQGLLQLLQSIPGKALFLLPNEQKLKEFFGLLKKSPDFAREVLTDKYSGNLTLRIKGLESAAKDYVLLLTTYHFLRKFFHSLPEFNTLLLWRLPFEASGARPEVATSSSPNSFLEHVLPRSLALFHTILFRFLAGRGTNKEIYIFDERILSEYDQAFLKYLQDFPDFRISTIDPIRNF